MRFAFCAALVLGCLAGSMGAPMVSLGFHPTSPLTGYPQIHSLQAFGGRIYMAYGDYNDYPAVVIVSYDPLFNEFRLEHSVASDALGYFRVIGGKLFATSIDPTHIDIRDYAFLDPATPAVGWQDRTPIGVFHSFDVCKAGSNLFLCGSKDSHENTPTGAMLAASGDDGLNWGVARVNESLSRYYWCFPLNGRVYVQDGYFDGQTFTSNSALSSYSFLYKPLNITPTGATTPFIAAISARNISGTQLFPVDLLRFDGTAVSALKSGVIDYAFDGTRLYTLDSANVIAMSNLISSPIVTWSDAPISGIPSGASAIEVSDGVAYVGTASGELWVGKVDGTAMTVTSPTVRDLLPDRFGRSLATAGRYLVVGAPDRAAQTPLAGAVEFFEEPETIGGPWQSAGSLTSPTPNFSGWFGRDVAIHGNVMVVSEAGYDSSNVDRGSAARVHVYQRSADGGWQSRETLDVPYSTSVAVRDHFVAVGTTNPAANQGAGYPSVRPYRILRSGTDVISLAAQTELRPGNVNFGYKPVVDVTFVDNVLAAGFAGDVSRAGGEGMASLFRRTTDGNSYSPSFYAEYATGAADHFGFAVAGDGEWLAVGAPRSDVVAWQRGSVYLWRRPAGAPAFEFKQTLPAPVAQAEALFGYSLSLRHGMLLVGAPGLSRNGQPYAGRVFRYRLDNDTWVADGEMTPPTGSRLEFGTAVVIGETFLAAGSRNSVGSTLEQRVAIMPNPRPFIGFDLWAERRAIAADPDLDGDGDGLGAFAEYVMNLDPSVPDSHISAGSPVPNGTPLGSPRIVVVSPQRLVFHYVKLWGDTRTRTEVQMSHDLTTWSSAEGIETRVSTVGEYELRERDISLPNPMPEIFLRLKTSSDRPAGGMLRPVK